QCSSRLPRPRAVPRTQTWPDDRSLVAPNAGAAPSKAARPIGPLLDIPLRTPVRAARDRPARRYNGPARRDGHGPSGRHARTPRNGERVARLIELLVRGRGGWIWRRDASPTR